MEIKWPEWPGSALAWLGSFEAQSIHVIFFSTLSKLQVTGTPDPNNGIYPAQEDSPDA
jgi:hypothetical protein